MRLTNKSWFTVYEAMIATFWRNLGILTLQNTDGSVKGNNKDSELAK